MLINLHQLVNEIKLVMMVKNYKSIIGANVLGFDSGLLLATISGIIIDPDTGIVEAFWVKPTTLPFKNAILRSQDIIEIKKHFYIKAEQVLAQAEDVLRIAAILEDGRTFLGSKIQNEEGRTYGECVDLSFDTKNFALTQIRARQTFLALLILDERLFSYDRIIRTLPNLILVDDDTTTRENLGATVPETAVG